MIPVIFVVTIRTDEGKTSHVHCTSAPEVDRLLIALTARFGPDNIRDGVRVDEKMPGWQCDGGDGCLLDA